jgi:hypothetical protein
MKKTALPAIAWGVRISGLPYRRLAFRFWPLPQK